MRKTKCYCDVCGREVKADDLVVFGAQDFYSVFIGIVGKKWDICKECLQEIGEKTRNKHSIKESE